MSAAPALVVQQEETETDNPHTHAASLCLSGFQPPKPLFRDNVRGEDAGGNATSSNLDPLCCQREKNVLVCVLVWTALCGFLTLWAITVWECGGSGGGRPRVPRPGAFWQDLSTEQPSATGPAAWGQSPPKAATQTRCG